MGLPAAIEKVSTLRELLQGQIVAFREVMPKHLTPERLIRVACAAASRAPLLLKCTPASILRAVMEAAQLGLDPSGSLGSAYLVPYQNKKNGTYEVQLIVGYRGLIDLARRSGEIASIEAHVVHAKERFKIAYGLNPVLEHEPLLEDDPGGMVAVYAVARLRDGTTQSEVMTKHQIDGIRARSRAGQSGPWVTDYEEMARKTVVKRLCKYLPLSVELEQALEADNIGEAGERTVIDIPGLEGEAPAHDSRTSEVAKRIANRRQKSTETAGADPEPEIPSAPPAAASTPSTDPGDLPGWAGGEPEPGSGG